MKLTAVLLVLGAFWKVADSSIFEIVRDTCDHAYGTVLDVTQEVNVIQCSATCSKYPGDVCQSIMYNAGNQTCMLNQEKETDLEQLPVSCGVMYAALIQKYFGCDYGWTMSGGRCYKYIDEWLTWDECKIECEAEGQGSRLASIYDLSTYADIWVVSEAAWNVPGCMTDWYYPWVGVHDTITEGVIMDLDNVPLPAVVLSTIYYNDLYANCGYVGENRIYMDGCHWEWSCMCETEPRMIYQRNK